MLRRLLAGAGVVAGILVGPGLMASSVSAEVTNNVRFTSVSTTDNPCEPGSNPISLTGTGHAVWYTTPDGTTKMQITVHLNGADSDGTEYRLNAKTYMEHFAWPSMFPYDGSYHANLISKGPGVNARIVVDWAMFPVNPAVTMVACLPAA
jgi:hypothetical protein